MEPNLVYIFNGRFPTERAHGIQLASRCDAFTEAGFDVKLVVPHRRNIASDNPAKYYGLKKELSIKRVFGWDPDWLWRISQRVGYYVQTLSSCFGIAWHILTTKYSADTIYYTRDYPTFLLLTLLRRKPFMELHDYRLTRPSLLLNWAFRNAHGIAFNSVGTKKAFEAHYNVPSSNVVVAQNGVDIESFHATLTKIQTRERLGLPPDAFLVGYTGRRETAGQDKGVAFVEAGFALAQKEITSAQFCMLGGKHSVPHSDIPLYLTAFDAVVLPLGSGSLAITTAPLKLFEYMAASCTIIAADAPSIRAYIDESCAVFYQRDSSEDFAKKLIVVARDPELRRRLGEAARKRASQYTWQASTALGIGIMLKSK